VLVTFRDGTTKAEATQAVQGAAAVSTDQVTEGDLVATSVEGDTLVGDTEGVAPDASAPMARVGVADGSTVVQAVAELEQDPTVESAQPNYIYHAMDDGAGDASTLAETVAEESGTTVATQSTASINDPSASSQWHLDRVGCYTAWSTTKCSRAVSVAVIDTGCSSTHPDLAANIKDYYVASGATSTISKTHGSHVAGLVSAVTNNGVGVSGVSYNAGLVICKADNSGGDFTDASLLDAYTHAMKVASTYNVKVVNMSLGVGTTDDSFSAWKDYGLMQKIDAAYEAGIVTVCAAGNTDSANHYYPPYAEYPGDYPTCVSVINTANDNTRSGSSNYNASGTNYKNVSAPGTSLYSTLGSGYGYLSGTSMASPVAAGIIALEFAEDSSLTASQAKGVLYGTASPSAVGQTGWSAGYGYGLASASGAVDAIIGANDVKLSGTSFAYTGSAVTPSVTVTTASDKTLTKDTDYTVSYSNNVSVGTATVTVAGKGSYSCSGNVASGSGYIGTVSKTFKIAVSVPYCADVLGAGSGAAYTIHTRRASDRLIDISGRSLANGGNAQMWHGNETPAQRFYVSFTGVSGGKGYYTVRNVCSGKVLDVAGGSSRTGANVQQYSGNGTKAQQWVAADADGDGYFTLTNVGSGLVLDIAGNSAADGANLQQWAANGTSAQDFCFTRCDSAGVTCGSSNVFVIHNVRNSSRVVDVCGASRSDMANVWLYDSNGTTAQRFWFSYDASNGYYTIHNKGNGKVVDVAGAAQENGSNIQQYSSNGTDAQHWSIKRNSNGSYTLYCACNGRCFDVDGGLTTNGRNIWCWDANGTTAQQWTFQEA
jgi:subtilisin family serine protease